MLKNLKGFNLPEIEKKVLHFWQSDDTFKKSLDKSKVGKPFVFFEGPPTANGRPGIHHVLTRAFKDIMLRYKTMRGYYVPRKAGWDTHGLPVEIEVEKELGINSKPEIEEYGIEKFNQKARESVWKYKSEWEKLTERVGFWIDFDDPYITYETNYIESLWWVIKQIHDRGYLYKGHRVAPWCSRCGTALSSHEIAQGYKTVTDTSVYVKFKLKSGQPLGTKQGVPENTYVLSWTTTPWTLPGNVALAVGEKIEYVIVYRKEGNYIVARDLVEKVFPDFNDLNFSSWEQIVTLNHKHPLVGLEYEPLFDIKPLQNDASHKIYAADFVTTEDGTGVVHTAVMYGEDDYQLGLKLDLPQHHTVTEQGMFTKDVPGLEELFVKDKDTELKILDYLKSHNLLLSEEQYEHDYPHCWRCSTPLLYYARESWFIAMSKLKDELLAANEKINWQPEHIKHGRFGNWLEDVKDWNLSRERYWGTPLPVWACEKCDHYEVIGGISDFKSRVVQNNTFYFVRHGEATHNLKRLCGPHKDTSDFTSELTEQGKRDVQATARELKKHSIDVIVASPLLRTKQTAEIIAKETGARVEYHDGLVDLNVGTEFFQKPFDGYFKRFQSDIEPFTRALSGGETWSEATKRMMLSFRDIGARYQEKNIVIVSHGHPLWFLNGGLQNLHPKDILTSPYPEKGSLYTVDSRPVPIGDGGEVDLHRPGIDAYTFDCPKCKGAMHRVKELIDGWFDSGAMPYAQWHYPFENKENIDKGIAFPADYIVEAVDQTRGWFYTLLAISVLLGKEHPYKNCLVLGHILDNKGLKMSKSKGNIVNPWEMADLHGADAIRWHFFTASDPGEPTRFDENDLKKASRRMFALLYNSYVFLSTYQGEDRKAVSILDRWIISRLRETTKEVTEHLDAYNIFKAGRAIEPLVDDLSRWYIRRSRKNPSLATLTHMLKGISILLAPFTPFFADALYQSVHVGGKSVHLEDWLDVEKEELDQKLLDDMSEVRRVASLALAKRDGAGVRVRQPLAKLMVKSDVLASNDALIDILKDEVNVKDVVFDQKLSDDVELDTELTPELKAEGKHREILRAIQGMRKDAKLSANDTIRIVVHPSSSQRIKDILVKNQDSTTTAVNADQIDFKEDRTDTSIEKDIDGDTASIGIRKI